MFFVFDLKGDEQLGFGVWKIWFPRSAGYAHGFCVCSLGCTLVQLAACKGIACKYRITTSFASEFVVITLAGPSLYTGSTPKSPSDSLVYALRVETHMPFPPNEKALAPLRHMSHRSVGFRRFGRVQRRPKPLHVSPLMDIKHRWHLKASAPSSNPLESQDQTD